MIRYNLNVKGLKMHKLSLHLIGYVRKKIYTFLKAYEFAELLFYSLSIFFDFSSHSIHVNENI